MISPKDIAHIDRQCEMIYPKYAVMSPGQRGAILDYAITWELPRYGYASQGLDGTLVRLNPAGTITTIVIAIIGLIISATAVIVPLAVESRKSREASRTEAATQTIVSQTAGIEAQTAVLTQEKKKKETTALIAMLATLGVAGVVAYIAMK